MKTISKYLFRSLVAIITISIYSCSDDDLISDSPNNTHDLFLGNCKILKFGQETSLFEASDFTLHILAPNGTIIQRKGNHIRENNISELILNEGLCDNNYRLLFLEYDIPDPDDPRFTKARFGLGCEISIIDGLPSILDTYNPSLQLFALHEQNNTYAINCDDDLKKLAKTINSDDNGVDSTYSFIQTCDIDLEYACFKTNKDYGWNPIGASNNTPFKSKYFGNNYTITGLNINRPNTFGVGLFGYTSMAYIKNVIIRNSTIRGDYATGALVGVITRPGNIKACTIVDSCHVDNCTISGTTYNSEEGGVNIGGLVGAIEEGTMLNLTSSSSSNNTIIATYNAGGLVGGSVNYAVANIGNCTSYDNNITAQISGAGGIIAVADSLYISGCTNTSTVIGGASSSDTGIGTGGIVGGSGASYITSCTNSGTIKGDEGVGGIIGSTRIKGSRNPEAPEPYAHNYTMVKYCGNTGNVSGEITVGGICGDSNFGSYAVYNSGKIEGKAQVGGILGAGVIAVTHNSVNSGEISVTNYDGNSFCGGIIGKADMTSIALCQNYGAVNSTGTHTAGIIGISGSTAVIHQCGNFGKINSTASGATGGIAGEIGNPSDWGPMNTAEVVIGTIEIAMAALGPIMAYAEHATEGALHIILKITEPLIEYSLVGTNTYFEYHTVHSIIHHEALEQIDVAVNGATSNISSDVNNVISDIRENTYSNIDVNGFDKSIITTNYIAEINNTLDYYIQDNGADTYNNSINTKRNNLCDAVEKKTEDKELAHSIIAGITLGASFIFTTGAVIAGFFTGGATAAAVFVGLGAITSVISGVNSIVKGSTEFEQNAVIVSQCVNAAKITSSSSDETGALIGVLNDYGIMRDCLNTANGDGKGGYFIGTAGDKSEITRCLSLGQNWERTIAKMEQLIDVSDVYFYNSESSTALNALSPSEIGDASNYDGWDIGTDKNLWTIPSSSSNKSYPIPFYSEMREK